MSRSDLPFGSEFSPAQIDLVALLELAHHYRNDWVAFEKSVRDRFFAGNETSDDNKRKLANNTKLSMRAYGLIGEDDASLTDIGQKLYELCHDKAILYEVFGRHLLLHCQGMNFVQCVLDMHAAGEVINLNSLRHWLGERGIVVPRGGKHMSTLRLWLEKTGVFVSDYRVDQVRIREILGIGIEQFDELAIFSLEQRIYLKTLANVDDSGPHLSNDIERLATTTYGTKFNEKNLPKQVLYPLRAAGYIELEKSTEGRGAKPFWVTATSKLLTDIAEPLIKQIEQQTRAELRPLLRKSLKDIREEVKYGSKHIRGLALEALAFKLMRLIDLSYVGTRLRGTATGGAEVDLVFEAKRLVFSRWQIQCKNTARVSLDDVAKEVGLTHFLKSNVIVIVSTGNISREARRYADKIMVDSNLCIIVINGSDLDNIEDRPATICDVLNREAYHAMDLKRLEL